MMWRVVWASHRCTIPLPLALDVGSSVLLLSTTIPGTRRYSGVLDNLLWLVEIDHVLYLISGPVQIALTLLVVFS